MSVEIPQSHRDLINGPRVAALTTIMPDGQPQSSLVWCNYDGECVCINTSLERQKSRNMLRNPKVSLLVVDPDDTGRYLEIRGEVELIREGALEHLDRIPREYTKHPQYYGYVFPGKRRLEERRIICRLHAKKITLDAIHR